MPASIRCAAEPFNFFALLFDLDRLRIEVLDEAVRHDHRFFARFACGAAPVEAEAEDVPEEAALLDN